MLNIELHFFLFQFSIADFLFFIHSFFKSNKGVYTIIFFHILLIYFNLINQIIIIILYNKQTNKANKLIIN